MGLMHMETLVPQLVGDEEWTDLVASRIALLLGARSQRKAELPDDLHPVGEGDRAEGDGAQLPAKR